jgi:outer membrane protein
MILSLCKPQWLAAIITATDARVMGAMVDPFGTARGLSQNVPDYRPWIADVITKACLLVIIIVVAAGTGLWSEAAQATEKGSVPLPLTQTTSLTFEDSVKIAINRSPFFTKSSLEIDLKRMDETDSRYDMIPPLTFQTYYYVNQPVNTGSKPYYLSFSTEPYNPMKAYFTLQAQKLATQMAILGHLKTISKGLERLAQFYLELDSLKKVEAYQKELISLNRENLTYVENRLTIGTATSLEVKLAKQEFQLAQTELDRLLMLQKRNQANLKNFLGLPANQECNPDLRDSQHQVLGKFDPATFTLEQAKSRSVEMKILEITKQLQGYNISLAIAKIFPTILFTTQTPNPLSATTGSGLYVGFGLDIPVWDGFKRIRNVSRQKVVLRQIEAQKEEKSNVIEDQWFAAQSKVSDQLIILKMAQSREDVARIKARQTEIRYQSGEITLPEFLESRKQVVGAQKEIVLKNLDYNKAVLALREISGDLGNTYVDERSWQK